MMNLRLRLQATVVVNLLFLTLFLVVTDYIDPNHKTAVRENFGFQSLLVLIILIQVESLVAKYYLSKIKILFGRGLDESTLLALRDASIPRLRRISKQAVQEIKGLNSRIEALFARAKNYPDLAKNKEFKKAVYGFKFEKAQKMLDIAERSAKRVADEAKRKADREEFKMKELIEEAVALGLLEQDVKNMSPSKLRDAIFMEKDWQSVIATATRLGCREVIERFGRPNRVQITLFLIRAQELARRAKFQGVDTEVQDLISQGKLNAAERLIAKKMREIEFSLVKKALQYRINLLPEQYRPPRQILFAVVCGCEFGGRAYHSALHDLEKSLKDCEA